MEIRGGWNTPEVAAAQLDFVKTELQHQDVVAPFVQFRRAMDAIGIHDGTLLDAGCGVGHYGLLCEQHYPQVRYYGADISAPMIALARTLAPRGMFFVRPFEENLFSDYDTALVSQVMELTEDPVAALEQVLRTFKKNLILHRIRLTDTDPIFFPEKTYCGYVGREYLWNLKMLTAMIESETGLPVQGGLWGDWPNMATLWVTR